MCRITVSYIIFYQGGTIDHGTHVSGPVSQSSAEKGHNAACTAVTTLAYFTMLIHEFLKKDPKTVPEKSPLIILNIKFDVCMAKNGKDTNHTRKFF